MNNTKLWRQATGRVMHGRQNTHTPLSHKLFHRYQFQLIRRSSLFSEYQKPEANKKTHVTRVQWQCGELNALRVHLTNAFSTKTARGCGSIEQFIRRRIALFITK